MKNSGEGVIMRRANTTAPENVVRFATSSNLAIHVTELEKNRKFLWLYPGV